MSFYGALLGGIVKLECPKCHEKQVRARVAPHHWVKCRRCRAQFKFSEGKPAFPMIKHR